MKLELREKIDMICQLGRKKCKKVRDGVYIVIYSTLYMDICIITYRHSVIYTLTCICMRFYSHDGSYMCISIYTNVYLHYIILYSTCICIYQSIYDVKMNDIIIYTTFYTLYNTIHV